MTASRFWWWFRCGLPGRQLLYAIMRNERAADRLDHAIREMLKK